MQKKKLGRVVIKGNTVDLNDAALVKHAKNDLIEDILNAIKNDELIHLIEIQKI